jgi:hypothetical protein
MEHSFLYFPTKELVATPAVFYLPFEEVLFPAEDGMPLHGGSFREIPENR